MPQLLLFFITGRFRTYLFPSDLLKWNSCLPAVAVSVMQFLSGTPSLCFLRRSRTTAFSISVTAKVNFANRFSTKQPEPQPESQVHVGGGGWQMAAFPQRQGGKRWMSLVSARPPTAESAASLVRVVWRGKVRVTVVGPPVHTIWMESDTGDS